MGVLGPDPHNYAFIFRNVRCNSIIWATYIIKMMEAVVLYTNSLDSKNETSAPINHFQMQELLSLNLQHRRFLYTRTNKPALCCRK